MLCYTASVRRIHTMKKSFYLLLTLLVLFALIGCSKPAPAAQAPAVVTSAPAAPTSDGTSDLKVDFRLNTAQADSENYFSFSGNIRYMAVDMDKVDATTGASVLGSTHLLQAYLYDVEGKTTFASGLRGLFLFGVNPYSQIETDNLTVSKAADGVITIQYAHRGTAYRIKTGSDGKLSFPNGSFEQRTIGYIQGAGPQVISKDFSTDGTSSTVDWAKVWDAGIAGGKAVDDKNEKAKTGNIVKAGSDPSSQYYFAGELPVTFENDVLSIKGSLTAVSRR